MTRPILARIHPDALAHNYRLAKQHAPQGRAMAVIKADGYGHGFLQVVAALPEADGFALLNSENALTLRDHGETRPLVLLEGFFDVAELRACAQAGIGVAIHHEAPAPYARNHAAARHRRTADRVAEAEYRHEPPRLSP